MPNIRSAKKALRQSERKRERNLKQTKAFRDALKEIKKLAASGKKDEAAKLLPKAYKALDKAAKNNVLKKNAAGRKKSRITKLLTSKA